MSPVKPTEEEAEYFARIELQKKTKYVEQLRSQMAEEEKKKQQELHFMHCPKCGTDLVEIEYKKVMIDNCPECGGIWFDCGELEQVLTENDSFLGGVLKIFKC